jgi:hypothetical protein
LAGYRKTLDIGVLKTINESLNAIVGELDTKITNLESDINSGTPLNPENYKQTSEYTANVNKIQVFLTIADKMVEQPQDITPAEYNQLTLVNDPKSRIYGKYTRFAVLLSFLMCFIHSLENGYSNIVIFEDDMKPLVTLETLTNSVTEFNESSLDIFYMGYCFLNCRQRIGKNYNYLVELTQPDLLCCHSMCVKTRILPKLIDYCIPMTTNSDELFRDFYVKNKIKVCVPKSIYFTQNRKGLDSLNESIPDDELFDTCNFK